MDTVSPAPVVTAATESPADPTPPPPPPAETSAPVEVTPPPVEVTTPAPVVTTSVPEVSTPPAPPSSETSTPAAAESSASTDPSAPTTEESTPSESDSTEPPDTEASLSLPGYTGSTTAGSTVNVHGDGYMPSENVAVSFGGELVGTFMTDDSGSFDGSFVVPSGTAGGKYAVVGVGETSERSACAKVKVVVPQAGGSIGEITRDGCKVSIPVTTTGPGDYRLDVWDDGTIIDHFEWTVTTPGLKTIVWTITEPAGKGATGVGFYLTSGEETLDSVDPYEYPDDVANSCSAAVPVTLVLPDYSGSTNPGNTLTATGTGYLPGEQVKLVFASTPADVGTVTTDSTGAYTTTFVVPPDAAAEIHHLTATGVTSGRAATAEINVVILATVQPESGEVMDATLTLASTGSDVNPGFATLATWLLVAGVGAVILGRRRATKG